MVRASIFWWGEYILMGKVIYNRQSAHVYLYLCALWLQGKHMQDHKKLAPSISHSMKPREVVDMSPMFPISSACVLLFLPTEKTEEDT